MLTNPLTDLTAWWLKHAALFCPRVDSYHINSSVHSVLLSMCYSIFVSTPCRVTSNCSRVRVQIVPLSSRCRSRGRAGFSVTAARKSSGMTHTTNTYTKAKLYVYIWPHWETNWVHLSTSSRKYRPAQSSTPLYEMQRHIWNSHMSGCICNSFINIPRFSHKGQSDISWEIKKDWSLTLQVNCRGLPSCYAALLRPSFYSHNVVWQNPCTQ